ncbi:hypothetical protein PSHT_00395 [Puccinia striiformis]|uniref:Uncharacterized protein n=1 Tax=Puccinia striiformis TaxID=27350 RepID=A0A2S4WNA8_9BASI|nr:hypothetical protein PSHT_00395 [Puccinia striiformis]
MCRVAQRLGGGFRCYAEVDTLLDRVHPESAENTISLLDQTLWREETLGVGRMYLGVSRSFMFRLHPFPPITNLYFRAVSCNFASKYSGFVHNMKSFLTIANVLISFYSYSFVDAESSGHLKVGAIGHSGPSKIFPFKKCEEFQISDGIAGTSLEKARKVFVEPFSGINLEEITQNDLNNLVTMMRFAVESENPFNDALKKAGSTKRRPNVPLTAGKVANKILKLLHQKLNIKQADPEGRIKEHQANYLLTANIPAALMVKIINRLAKNLKLDRHYAGRKMISYLSFNGKDGEKGTKETKGTKEGTQD